MRNSSRLVAEHRRELLGDGRTRGLRRGRLAFHVVDRQIDVERAQVLFQAMQFGGAGGGTNYGFCASTQARAIWAVVAFLSSSERFAIDGKVRRRWAAAVGDHPSSEPDPVSSNGKRSDMDIQSIISLLLSAGSSVLSLGSSVLSL
ncbi:hypothetical protein ACFYU5_15720 [Nocardia aobensis]|uniref:Uncharacterized protein n=1 Tax=Nocardia aobensis TaxID=257277 RepID=A0ABW6P3H2_9NOCA